MESILLASGSPRRKQLLQIVGIPFIQVNPHIDEHIIMNDPDVDFNRSIDDICLLISERKVKAVSSHPETRHIQWIVGVDTLIGLDNEIIGKPKNEPEARDILKKLSGRVHTVYSGMTLYVRDKEKYTRKVTSTEVKFLKMSGDEIEFYLDSREWQGAAGAYRIQERGAFFVEWLKGSYSNVVGLPLGTFYGILKENDYPFINLPARIE